MDEKIPLENLWQALMPDASEQLYAIVDTAAHTHIHSHIVAWQPPAIALQPEGHTLPEEAGPWLVALNKTNNFSDWFFQEGLFDNWGILLHSATPLLALADQLSPWLLAHHIDKQQHLLMRYYDPTRIYAYLSQLSAAEREQWFANISAILRHTNVDQNIERLSFQSGELIRKAVAIDLSENEQEASDVTN